MESILKKFQDRLNDVSRRNRAIRLSRIIKKKTFDISNLSVIDKEKAIKLIDAVFFEGKSFNLINTNIEDKEEEKILKEVLYLKREVDFILKEKGYYECYLGYPFIQGNFFDGSFFRAPLFLVPLKIDINRTTQKVVLHPLENSGVIINKTFLLAFNKYNKGFKNIEIDKLEDLEEIKREDLINFAVDLFEKLNMTVELGEFKRGFLKSLDVLKADNLPENLVGKIEFLPFSILGQFSQLNSALNNDYEDIIKNKRSNELSELIMGNESERDLEERFDDEKLIDSSEKDNFFITCPDISQEQVLIESRSGKGLVIHGPPGTGKSQVITNLIADNLLRNKKILLVCEKRAALDVVKNRLASKNLNKHCLLVHDSQNDRDRIFRQIESTLNEFDSKDGGYNQEEFKKFNEAMLEKANNFDNKLKELKNIIDKMHQTQKFGTSLYHLYRNSNKEKGITLDLSEKKFDNANFKELQVSAEIISKLAERFYKFENKDYPLFYRKRFGTTFDDIKFKESMINLLKILETLEGILYTKEFKKDLESINRQTKLKFEDFIQIQSELKQLHEKDKNKILKLFDSSWWLLRSKYKEIRDKGELEETIKRWALLNKSIDELSKSLVYLETIFESEFLDNIKENVLDFRTNTEIINKIIKKLDELEEVVIFDAQISSLKDLEIDLAKQCFKNIKPIKNSASIWEETIKNNFYIKWIREVELKNPQIKEFSYEYYNRARDKLASLIKEKTDMIPKVIYESFINKYRKLKWDDYDFDGRKKNYNRLKDLIHEVSKKRRKMTLRQLFNEFHNEGLLELFPCWMCSPETVSSTFPMKNNLFDIVIFDEASQCKVEKAIPSIIRAKKLIVAGDEKQLPPTTFFMTSIEEDIDEMEEYGYDEQQLLENESLLERAKTILPGKRLIYHYRSNHEALINFSNFAFYDSYLRIIPKNNIGNSPVIDYRNVKGVWDSGTNLKEAKEVVNFIKDFLLNNKDNLTIGVITFNIKQKDLIEELLDEAASKNNEFAKLLDKEKERYNNEEHIGLFVKNIENVQGDERDVILFSISYGFDKVTKKFQYRFGPLNGPYGPNRLNVAISRAREKIIVFNSFEPTDLQYSGSFEGPKLLRSYLEYCKLISENDCQSANLKLDSLNQTETKCEDFDEYDSDFEGEVRDALVKQGYQVKTQAGCKGYKIDLAIIHPKDKNRFIAGIECDGAKYHSSKSAKDRDLYRQRVLEDAGWKILRIWSRDWWKDPSGEIKRIDREIKKLI